MSHNPSPSRSFIPQVMATPVESLEFTERSAHVACPACRNELFIGSLNGMKVAACQSCQGILIESESLAASVGEKRAEYKGPDAKPTPIDQRELQRQRACPSCGGRFETHPYCGPGNCIIDSCMGCRLIWLDQGELTSMIKAPGLRG